MRIGEKKDAFVPRCLLQLGTKASETLALERAAHRNHQPGAAGDVKVIFGVGRRNDGAGGL